MANNKILLKTTIFEFVLGVELMSVHWYKNDNLAEKRKYRVEVFRGGELRATFYTDFNISEISSFRFLLTKELGF